VVVVVVVVVVVECGSNSETKRSTTRAGARRTKSVPVPVSMPDSVASVGMLSVAISTTFGGCDAEEAGGRRDGTGGRVVMVMGEE